MIMHSVLCMICFLGGFLHRVLCRNGGVVVAFLHSGLCMIIGRRRG
jgi:hypothetical protein